MNNPIIHTERLILRLPQMSDLDRWIELMADEQSTRYVGGVQTPNLAWRSFMSMAGAWGMTGISMFSLQERSSGRWVGRCGPWRPQGWPGNEIGWSLHPDSWGKGYATEAAVAALDYASDVLGWKQVIHIIDPDNLASIKVAQRLGSSNLGPCQLPPPFEQARCELWGQERADRTGPAQQGVG